MSAPGSRAHTRTHTHIDTFTHTHTHSHTHTFTHTHIHTHTCTHTHAHTHTSGHGHGRHGRHGQHAHGPRHAKPTAKAQCWQLSHAGLQAGRWHARRCSEGMVGAGANGWASTVAGWGPCLRVQGISTVPPLPAGCCTQCCSTQHRQVRTHCLHARAPHPHPPFCPRPHAHASNPRPHTTAAGSCLWARSPLRRQRRTCGASSARWATSKSWSSSARLRARARAAHLSRMRPGGPAARARAAPNQSG